jgi:hypothetical protein
MVAEGYPMYGDLPREYGLAWQPSHLGNLNPPQFQLLFVPLVPLGYRLASVVWLVLNGAAGALSLALIALETREWITPKRAAIAGAVILGSAPWTSLAVTGEMALLLLLPFTLAWVAARRGHWTWAGAWLGVVLGLKLFALIVVPWLILRRRWRALAVMLLVAAGMFASGTWAFGFQALLDWVHGLGRTTWWWLSMNASIRGLAERCFNPGAGYAAVLRSPTMARGLSFALAGLVGLITARQFWLLRRLHTPAAPSRVDREMLLLVVTALLLSPLGWVYYFVLATPPLAGLIAANDRHAPSSEGLAVLALLLLYIPVEVADAGQPSIFGTLTLASSYSWAALVLWVSIIRSEQSPHAQAGLLCSWVRSSRAEFVRPN